MARLTPDAFVEHLGRCRATAILRTPHEDAGAPAMQAAVNAGFRIIEFTLTTPGALERVAEFSRQRDLVVGAGTVLDADAARAAVDAGAAFLVSPVVDEAVVDEARRLGVAAMPGAQTPTEMLRAHRAGAPLVKLFPAGSPAALRLIRGPLPFLRIVPTGGVDLDNAAAYLAAGAFAVGFVHPLFVPEDIETGRFDRIEARARRMLEAVNAAQAH